MRPFAILRFLPLLGTPIAFAQPATAPEFRFPPLAPVVQAAAEKTNLPLTGFDASIDRSDLREGDKIVALIDHTEGKHHKQWLVLFVAKTLTAEEQARPPLTGVKLYTTNGHTYDYSGQLAALAIRCLGPYSLDASPSDISRKAKDQWSSTLVNSAYLGLGFDEMCRMALRVDETGRAIAQREQRGVSFNFSSGTSEFPPEQVEHSLSELQPFNLTAPEERAFAGSQLALLSFFEIALRTPGLNDVLASVTDIPWLSILSHGGKMPEIDFKWLNPVQILSPETWGLPLGTPVYAHPLLLKLNDKPALLCQLAVLAPRPPFLTSAGIIGITAQRPDRKGPQLSIRLIAARLAPELDMVPAPASKD